MEGCTFLYAKEKYEKKRATVPLDRFASREQTCFCTSFATPPKTSSHRSFGF